MIPSIDQQLILQMLWWVEIFAWGFFSVTSTLDTVVAGCDSPVLHFNVSWGVCELAFGVWSGTLIPLELPANLKLEPAGVLPVQQVIHIHHCCHIISRQNQSVFVTSKKVFVDHRSYAP